MLKSNRSLLVGILSIAASSAAVAANWDSCDKWATWTNGGYTLYNNVWGANPGWQCIWANTGSHWRVSCNHGTSGGIKSYPNSNRDLNRSANNVSSCRTTFNVSRHSNGAFTTTFDVWGNGSDYEIMLWMNKVGAVGPIGSLQASNQTIGGHTWNVYKGTNGSIQVFSFIRTSNTNSGTVDHKAIWNWVQNRGWWNNPTIGKRQFGFEITNTGASNASFVVNSRSDSSS
jgi:hypothetical protein